MPYRRDWLKMCTVIPLFKWYSIFSLSPTVGFSPHLQVWSFGTALNTLNILNLLYEQVLLNNLLEWPLDRATPAVSNCFCLLCPAKLTVSWLYFDIWHKDMTVVLIFSSNSQRESKISVSPKLPDYSSKEAIHETASCYQLPDHHAMICSDWLFFKSINCHPSLPYTFGYRVVLISLYLIT